MALKVPVDEPPVAARPTVTPELIRLLFKSLSVAVMVTLLPETTVPELTVMVDLVVLGAAGTTVSATVIPVSAPLMVTPIVCGVPATRPEYVTV